MTRGSKALIVLLVAVLGVWGCAKGPANQSSAQAERIKALEAKCAKLEEDYRSAATARDLTRKRLQSAEEERDALTKERDDLHKQIDQRTGERDLLQTRCERMRRGLQSLIGQDDAMLQPAPAVVPVISTASSTGG
jgi:predicted  nucleic acid-binding Zn-ribbon protein